MLNGSSSALSVGRTITSCSNHGNVVVIWVGRPGYKGQFRTSFNYETLIIIARSQSLKM